MFFKRVSLILLAIVTSTAIIGIFDEFTEAVDKGFDTPVDPRCITDCATHSTNIATGAVWCGFLAIIWLWIFRRRRKKMNQSLTKTPPREQEPVLAKKSQRKKKSREGLFDDSEDDFFGSDDGQGSIFS